MALFRRTNKLVAQVGEFCDTLSQGGLAFKMAIRLFMDGRRESFEEKQLQVNQLESRADKLRRDIERRLYSDMLIPDSRGDVLGLLENMDGVLNACEGALWSFANERPEIPETFRADYISLADCVVDSVETLVESARTFFRDVRAVPDHVHKVLFYEKEADKISTRLKQGIFASDLELSRKLQLRDLVNCIDLIANVAEDVADRLAIYAIKRPT